MQTTFKHLSPVNYARIAGLLYLLIAILGTFGIAYVPGKIIVLEDPSATIENLKNNLTLFRLGVSADTLVFLMEVMVTAMLYQMFKQVNKTLSLVAFLSRFAMSVIMGINLVVYVTPLFLLNDSNFNSYFNPDQLKTLVMLFFKIHADGIMLWGLFFGLHLIVLGYLVYRSVNYPKILGVLMMVGSLGYLLESFAQFSLPESMVIKVVAAVFLSVVVVGELSFTFWLLIKGIKKTEYRRATPETFRRQEDWD